MRTHHPLPTCAVLLTLAVTTSAGPPATQPAATQPAAPSIARPVAEAYGIDGWEKIQRLDFTFNVDLPGRDKTVTRQWSWFPKDNTIKHHLNGQSIGISNDRAKVARLAEGFQQSHKQFINDSYWLLFPFQPIWSNPTVTDEGTAPRPIGDGSARKITVQYPDEGGYTPGDAYDLYLNEHGRIQQWVFRRGSKENGKAMTWEKHRQLGPIVVSLEHWGADRKFHLWFSDVRAELVGEDEPVTPQAIDR